MIIIITTGDEGGVVEVGVGYGDIYGEENRGGGGGGGDNNNPVTVNSH